MRAFLDNLKKLIRKMNYLYVQLIVAKILEAMILVFSKRYHGVLLFIWIECGNCFLYLFFIDWKKTFTIQLVKN